VIDWWGASNHEIARAAPPLSPGLIDKIRPLFGLSPQEAERDRFLPLAEVARVMAATGTPFWRSSRPAS
jgi:hypothetical protein